MQAKTASLGRACQRTEALKIILATNVDDPENNGSALRLQAGLLARRFGLPDAIATTVAALAFGSLAR